MTGKGVISENNGLHVDVRGKINRCLTSLIFGFLAKSGLSQQPVRTRFLVVDRDH